LYRIKLIISAGSCRELTLFVRHWGWPGWHLRANARQRRIREFSANSSGEFAEYFTACDPRNGVKGICQLMF
jgi:hypothetical protein